VLRRVDTEEDYSVMKIWTFLPAEFAKYVHCSSRN